MNSLNAALDFCVRFEEIFPFKDGNDRVESQIERQKLYAASRPYLPADYTED